MIRIIQVLIFLFPLIAISQVDAAALKEAISYYKTEEYKSAVIAFKKLEKNGYASDDLYYNLASSYFKQDRLAEAVLYYNKALKLNPRHSPSKKNLVIVNDLRASDISPIPDFFLQQWWKVFYNFMSSTFWVMLCLLSLAGSLYFFYRWLFTASKFKSISSCCILFGVAMLFFLAARSSYNDRYNNLYLVNIEAATIHSGPNEKSNEVLQIIPGEKLKVMDKLGEWYQVSLINKEQGWLNANGVKEI